MPITIDNTSHLNSDYGRYPGDSSSVRDGSVPVSSYSGRGDLSSGTTVTGQIIEKDGNQVTIRLGNDQTISARLQGNADIEVGMKMTFEVARGADNKTALRPLFSNLANNSAAMSALKAAGLPVNNTTLAMTDRMMSESMPVNRNALAEMFRNVSAHSNVSPESIVQMTKLNMPLTESNVIQFDNYRNFEHRITNDLQNVSDGVANLFREAVGDLTDISGNGSQVFGNMTAAEVVNEVLNLIDPDSLETIIPDKDAAGVSQSVQGSEQTVTGNTAVTADTSPDPAVPNNAEQAAGENEAVRAETTDGDTNITGQAAAENTALTGHGGASIIRSTVDSFISDIRDIFTSGRDDNVNIPLNNNISLTPAEQQVLTDSLSEIMELSGQETGVTQPLDPSQIMSSVKGLVEEYLSGEDTGISAPGVPDTDTLETTGQKETAGVNTRPEEIPLREDNTAAGRTEAGAETVKDAAATVQDASEHASKSALIKAKITEKLGNLLKSEGFTKLVKDSVKAQMSIKPADVAQNGKIDELYEKITRTSARVSQLMENIGRPDSPAAQSAAALNDNVSFMNQLNEFVNYIQLPLRMAGEDANGELYVYTNKKNLENNDGNYSALLHLDMEHLGPMDVYVTMRDHVKVNTNFYLQSEELLDFMEAHIDQLTKRLADKGYDTSTRVTRKEKGEPITPIADEFTKDDAKNNTQVVVSKMRFDVRA